MKNETPKVYDHPPGQTKSPRILPKTKFTLLLKFLAASCVMGNVGAASPLLITAPDPSPSPDPSPTACQCFGELQVMRGELKVVREECDAKHENARGDADAKFELIFQHLGMMPPPSSPPSPPISPPKPPPRSS